ncbi:MAG: sulfurtransferase [Thermomicrobiales bacterium]
MILSTNGYANPHALVSTDWAEKHLATPGVRFVEVDVDTSAYDSGHLPGAVGWNWQTQLQQAVSRDIPEKSAFEVLLQQSGITNDTHVVLYGDNSNWFAAYAFWLLRVYGHASVSLMNGGRQRWIDEARQLTQLSSNVSPTTYRATAANSSLRAFRDQVAASIGTSTVRLVDVRSPQEFSGELLAPAHLPQEGAQRAGHIPGAVNIPWASAVQEDGTFKSSDELRTIYHAVNGGSPAGVIAYCRIGERSAHTWFVLTELLGFDDVRNYDGSWTEWGSIIAAPIER